ncbi:MAG: heavy metal-responsive transcriptional regulator [Pseudanabaena frigida]|uniref:Heavy metal-responsive transcriptional regulator n=1 Tax=Pseudanabaena frigida TaxID=945775 RepID=A0A2W4XW72_9CYAN|nr:MAG: heavy metal-responsive transcriptional regulator [Pseudanabaena frigida]
MLIGELAKKTGLTKDTIRFYEKRGLIESQERQAGMRTYMDFSPEMLDRVAMIVQGKSLGFTLSEMKHLMDTWGNMEMPIAEKLKIIDSKLDEITDKMKQLEQIKNYLTTKRNKVIQASKN